MATLVEGGCFCGFVRYASAGPVSNETNCHCTICRRTTGAPFVAWLTVPRVSFELSGAPTWFRSSEHATRSFCPRFGTQLSFESDESPDEFDDSTGSLDEPARFPPKDHTWVSSKLAWVELDDGLPSFPQART